MFYVAIILFGIVIVAALAALANDAVEAWMRRRG